jgi:hypothetical protein
MHLKLLILTSLLALAAAFPKGMPIWFKRDTRYAVTKRPEIRSTIPRRTVCRGCLDCPCPAVERPSRYRIPFLASSSIEIPESQTKPVTVDETDDAVVKRQLVSPEMLKPHDHEGPRSIHEHETINPVGETQTKPVATADASSDVVIPGGEADTPNMDATPDIDAAVVQRLPRAVCPNRKARPNRKTPWCDEKYGGCVECIHGRTHLLPWCDPKGVCFYRDNNMGPTVWVSPEGGWGVKEEETPPVGTVNERRRSKRRWEQVWKEVAKGYRTEALTDSLLPRDDSVRSVCGGQVEHATEEDEFVGREHRRPTTEKEEQEKRKYK